MMPAVILVVGGIGSWRARVKMTLEGAGYAVREATTDSDALALAIEHWPDLVLLDLHMAGDDGFTLIGRLRTLPGGSTLSIVAVVGTLTDAWPDPMMQVDVTDYLVTPVDSARLLETVRTHLPHR